MASAGGRDPRPHNLRRPGANTPACPYTPRNHAAVTFVLGWSGPRRAV